MNKLLLIQNREVKTIYIKATLTYKIENNMDVQFQYDITHICTYWRSKYIKKETILTAYNTTVLKIWLRARRACCSCVDITCQSQFSGSLKLGKHSIQKQQNTLYINSNSTINQNSKRWNDMWVISYYVNTSTKFLLQI